MSISAEEKNRYLRETAIVLAREEFHTNKTHTGGLCIQLDGSPLCEVTETGGVAYRRFNTEKETSVTSRIALKPSMICKL